MLDIFFIFINLSFDKYKYTLAEKKIRKYILLDRIVTYLLWNLIASSGLMTYFRAIVTYRQTFSILCLFWRCREFKSWMHELTAAPFRTKSC